MKNYCTDKAFKKNVEPKKLRITMCYILQFILVDKEFLITNKYLLKKVGT